jgi:hypothetical protein
LLNTSALSLEQAPPIGVPYLFLLSAPWFAVAAGVALAWFGGDLLITRWAPATLGVVHLLGLGFLGLVICGALLQLLPVLAGAPVPGVVWVSRLVYGLLMTGTPVLVMGFLTSRTDLQLFAVPLLVAGVLVLLVALLLALRRAQGAAETLRAIEFSAGGLLVAAALGATIVLALNARAGLFSLPGWVDLHLSWALLGWSGVLLLGMWFLLVPLFHVTAPYPAGFRSHAPTFMFLWLLGMTVGHVARSELLRSAGVATALAVLAAFALLTLRLQAGRRRAVWDPTLSFWWLGLVGLLGAVGAWLLDAPGTLVGTLALAGAGVAIPSGVLYKVVPFLAWFHLQAVQIERARPDVTVPHVKAYVSDRLAYAHFALQAAALALMLVALAGWELAARPAGLLFAAAFSLQGVGLLRVYQRYRQLLIQLSALG